MPIKKAVIDTDILSAIMRKNPIALGKAKAYLKEHKQFTFSIITRYEILRGLKAKDAVKQVGRFDSFCAKNILLPLSDESVEQAADIYASLKKKGRPIGDADILIAATALVHGLAIVTNNEKHFQHINGLCVENWLIE